ncbi:MAG: hypothetical protein R3F56_09400 [Planctomycetota bacterium]
MRPLPLLLAGVTLASCFLLVRHRDTEPARDLDVGLGEEGDEAEGHPRAEFLRWQQRKDEQGKIHGEVLYREAAALKARLAASPTADGPANWTLLGPGNFGGRIRSILIHPTNPNVMWVGSVSGGVWKSTNAGGSWSALPDLPNVLAITTMVLDPSDPNTIFAGTGEECYFQAAEGSSNSAVNFGAGIFKSTDGGNTWAQIPSTAGAAWNSVSRLAVDSTNPSNMLAATISGIWRSTDGGNTWSQRTTSKTYDVDFDPNNRTRCVAGLANGVAQYSTDGGNTWSNGTSTGGVRVELAFARATPGTVFAAVNTNGNLTVWRSTDNGQTYTRQSGNVVTVLASYTGAIWVDPTNSNNVLVGGLDLYRSTNAGVSFSKISSWSSYPANSAHADHHIIVEHPLFDGSSNRTVFFGNDGGIQRATNYGTVSNLSGWTNLANNLAITQFYGCCMNPTSGTVLGGAQDNGTLRATAISGVNGWTEPLGGDGSFCASDPTDPNTFYLQYYYLNLYRSTNGGASQGSSIKGAISDATPNFMSYILLDPNDINRLWACGARLWRANNAKTGSPPTWASVKAAISCPSTAPEKPSPDHFIDNPPCNISTVAVAKGNSNIVWVGHNNGDVYYTTNGLASSPTWVQVDTNNPPLPNRWVSRIVIDKDNPSRVSVSFMGFTSNNVWRTDDTGQTWHSISGSGTGTLPQVPVSCIVQHRVAGARFYAATDLGLYFTNDDGANWQPAVGGPTIVPMDELVWRNDRTLVVATHGRSMWTCDVDPASVTPVGTGCGGAAPPSLTVAAPIIGATQNYTLANAAANAPVALLLTPGPANPTPIGPCVIQPGLTGMVSLSVGSTNASGSLSVGLPLPANGQLAGAVMTAQEFIVQLGGPLLGAGQLSNGAEMTFGF